MSDRIYKINELLKEEVGGILQKEVGLSEGVLTITAVETTNDLRQSTIWLSYFGNDEKTAVAAVAEKARDVQAKINHRLSLKHVPRLEYRFDKSGAYADTINQVLKKMGSDLK